MPLRTIIRASVASLLLLATTAIAQDDTTIEIAPGVLMPYVNLGGVVSAPSNYTEWLALGGRGIDTALTYGDVVQKKVAQALQATSVPRSEIFVTTKVPCCPLKQSSKCKDPEYDGSIAADIAADIAILGNVDLMLLHWPCNTYEQTLQAYTDLEKALEQGVTRAIGVSNFNASLLARLKDDVTTQPAVNQCGHSVGAHNETHNPQIGGDDATAAYCSKWGISYSAYSPLGGLSKLDIYKNPTVKEIASSFNPPISPAQVALRWLIQQKITAVTAANNKDYLAEDMDVFSFHLSKNDMSRLTAL